MVVVDDAHVTTLAVDPTVRRHPVAEGLEQEEGIIALQAETPGGGQFEFKDIYLTKLPKKK